MNFKDALKALRNGGRLTRAAWNNVDQYVFFGKEPFSIEGENKPDPINGFLCLRISARVYNTYWKPESEDTNAKDWAVVT